MTEVFTDASINFKEKKATYGIHILFEDGTEENAAGFCDFSRNITVCECRAVSKALELLKGRAKSVKVFTDSENLCKVIYKPTGREPAEIRRAIQLLRRKFRHYKEVIIQLVPRDRVEISHMMARAVLK
jgi:ribonuclease HI